MFKRIVVKGFRSFDAYVGIDLVDLGPVNVIIGPNNAGKSNLGRYLAFVKRLGALVAQAHTRGTYDPGAGAQNAEWVTLGETVYGASDRWRKGSTPMYSRVELDEVVPSVMDHASDFVRDGSASIEVTTEYRAGPDARWTATFRPTAPLTIPPPDPIGNNADPREAAAFVQRRDGERRFAAGGWLAESLFHAVVEVRAVRDVDRPGTPQTERPPTARRGVTEIDGSEVVGEWKKFMDDESRSEEATGARSDLEGWLARLLGERQLLGERHLRIEPKDTTFEITLGDGTRCRLTELGTGVTEVVVLLASLLCLGRLTHRAIVIEEPEAHLHPAAVVELLRIVRTAFPRAQLFVTSHSTVLMDAIEPDWRVFHFHREPGTGATRARAIDLGGSAEAAAVRLALLADLGVRPSQVFLANTVLFVDGPSDVIYLRRLLRDAQLTEGRDFTFVAYGGGGGAHLGLGEGALIDLLRISPNPIVLCDEDGGLDTPGRKWVRELRVVAQATRVGTVLPLCVREVENLVAPEALNLATRAIVKRMENDDGAQEALTFGPVSLGDKDEFKFAIAAAALGKDGRALSPAERGRLAERLDGLKVRLAQQVVVGTGAVFGPAGVALRDRLARMISGTS